MQLIRDFGFLSRNGVLPVQGGLLDQPARFVEAVEIIDDERRIVADALARLGAKGG